MLSGPSTELSNWRNPEAMTLGRSIGLGILGCGTVGTGLLRALRGRQTGLAHGMNLEVRHVLVRDLSRPRDVDVPADVFTNDVERILGDPEVDIVVELMGGTEPAGAYVRRSLQAGKHVVTANKELIAKFGSELFSLARQRGVELRYEASVGGGMPVVRLLQEDLAGNVVMRLEAIINGTTNYILTRMAVDGASLEDALKEAQALGYAEPDPSNDLNGHDAVFKLAILVRLAFGIEVAPEDIYREGIGTVVPQDFVDAASLGYGVKLLALARRQGDGIVAGVHPALVPGHHPLARIDGVLNAVRVEGDLVGSLLISGRGAGPEPTASALLADILGLSGRIANGCPSANYLRENGALRLLPFDEAEYAYFLRLRTSEATTSEDGISDLLARSGVQTTSVTRQSRDGRLWAIVLTAPTTGVRLRSAVGMLQRGGNVAVEKVLRVLN